MQDADPTLTAEAPPAGGIRRRPTGEPPPLPRKITQGTWWWLGGLFVVLVLWGIIASTRLGLWFNERDTSVLQPLVDLRTDGLTSVAEQVQRAGLWWVVPVVGWGTIIVLVVFRRWRHLLVFLVALVVAAQLAVGVSQLIARNRPVEVEILGWWEGFAHPSRPMASLCAVLAGAVLSLAPPGRARRLAMAGAGLVAAVFAAAQLYLAVEHPTDVLIGAVMGLAITIVAFRLLVPENIFPVTYRRGRTAHLDVSGARGRAIVRAVDEQLGVTVTNVEPFALEGSSGSTPLRLTVEEGPGTVFAKLQAQSHLRSDRWYKLGRTLRYGQLEDESRFQNVRRLVEREDYLLRLMRDAGVPCPEPYGVVEITPEREYLSVTEFLDGAVELTEADVDDDIVDQALTAVRTMWDAGLAHRDIKPANVMVRDGRVYLIDVAFGQLHASPWREAVDLSNMMLVLALRTDPERVLERARRQFSDDEIAEAFAASRGVTLPSELKRHIRDSGRDLLEEFRALVSHREPIRIQRWSLRRVLLTVWVVLLTVFGLAFVIGNLGNAGLT
jgi:tRNA A-37 threonylcarbamoyl transferase component Bud32/membrane-associated phospholipid phosphatase